MLDFDPELSVAVEGKEILVTLPGGQLRRHVLAPRPQPPARLNIVFVERSVGRARRLQLGIRPRLIRPASRERPRPRMLMMGAK